MEMQARVLTRQELPGFRPYLLPGTAAAIQRGDEDLLALGAVSGRHALGAVAARLTEDGEAALTDLFVDEAARRQGVGTYLLGELVQALLELGIDQLTADYALKGEDLTAMDALMTKAGAEPQFRARSFRADSRDYHDHHLLGTCFTSQYRTPEGVIPFFQLSPQELEELEEAEDIPYVLSWPLLKDRAVPDLSVATVRQREARAYLLAEESADGGFVLLAAVRREGSKGSDFLAMLRELLNRCWYWRGGDFPFYFSAINEHTERLARSLMGDRCQIYEEHVCAFLLDDGADEL